MKPNQRRWSLTVAAAATLQIGAAASASGPRGLPACPDILTDFYCHRLRTELPALFSNATPGSLRACEDIHPIASNPTRICWAGRYQGRVAPAADDERFLVRIFPDIGAQPHPQPIFSRVFSQSGTPGVDRLEMDCLDLCPGGSAPDSGGHYVYSVEVAAGLPMMADVCYYVEISCLGSAEAGLDWAWCSSYEGNDWSSLQAADGQYQFHSAVPHNRAICLGGGLNSWFGMCGLPGGPPPLCQDPYSHGQPPDLATRLTLLASTPGSSASDGFEPIERAENFQVAATTSISGVCFAGNWVGGSPGEPLPDPDWDVIYYADDAGIPGGPAPLAAFRVGTTPGVTHFSFGGSEVAVDHPPLALEPGRCYWLSIGRVQGHAASEPRWAWALTTNSAPVADGSFAERSLASPAPGPWSRSTFTHRRPGTDLAVRVSNFQYLFKGGPLASPVSCNDCNENGIDDAVEIAQNPALDCYDPAGPLGTMGGPDGRIDSCQCQANWNRDGAVNSADITAFITSWLASVQAGDTSADLNCSGSTDSGDLTAFLTAWIASVTSIIPDGCP